MHSPSLSGGPDRVQLAIDAFNRYREEREPQFAARQRQIGQRAATLGRIGAGMTTTELADSGVLFRRDLDREERRLRDEAVGLELSDRRSILDASLTAGSTFTGEDLATAGFEQGLRGEARTEREAGNTATIRSADLALAPKQA